MTTTFAAFCGLFWTAAYVLIIRAGLRDRSYGMPVAAFATNLSWEFSYSFIHPSPHLQLLINIVWFLFDCAIGYTIVRFGPDEFPQLPRPVFYAGLSGLIALSVPLVDLFDAQFDGGNGVLSAFVMNVLMSGLFLGMLIARRGSRGQSVGIAAAKMTGTVFASLTEAARLHSGLDPQLHGGLMPCLYISCFVLDLLYTGALAAVRRRERAAATPANSGLESDAAGGTGRDIVAAEP